LRDPVWQVTPRSSEMEFQLRALVFLTYCRNVPIPKTVTNYQTYVADGSCHLPGATASRLYHGLWMHADRIKHNVDENAE